MMDPSQTGQTAEDKKAVARLTYEPPAIIYEGVISTRAGSGGNLLPGDIKEGVDPGDLFGSGG